MPEAETNPKGIGVFMNKIDKQIIKSIIRANTGAPENMIEFVEQLPEEHFTTPPDDYIGYRMMNTGTQLCHIGKYVATLEDTCYHRDRARGRYFYTLRIYITESATVADISKFLRVHKTFYRKREI